jgi:hypothetical protein
MRLSFGREAAVVIPGLLPTANDVIFVQEGGVIPVVDFSIANATLSRRKLACIVVYTKTMLESGNVDSLVRQTLNEAVGLRLDANLFDATAGDAVRPPGLRAGIAATAASASTIPTEAMLADVAALTGAVAAVAGNTPIVLVANPAQAAALRLRLDDSSRVFSSSALAAGVVMAIAANALAVVVDPQPEFEIRSGPTLHMDDAATAIGVAGSPNVVASPTRSLYQTDSVGIKLRLNVSWVLRTTGATSWVENVVW